MMIFQRRTLMPESAVASSLQPIENVYRPMIVRFRMTAATIATSDEDEHRVREVDPGDDRPVR